MQVARQVGLPFLANVDEYDDTVFNQMQMLAVERELASLVSSGECQPEAEEIVGAWETVRGRPHRYLVFNGD